MLKVAAVKASGNLAYERGLLPSIAHTVPPPAEEATFHWSVRPPGGMFLGRVYSDGSRLDGPTSLLARNGWAFVVLNDDDETVASASGLPPAWVDNIPGTEAWALSQAGQLALPGTTFFVDCQPCVDAFHAGAVACSRDSNPLARVHAAMHLALDDVPAASVMWMPAHLKPGSCGQVARGDGFLVEEIDVLANDMADGMAKAAVLAHRVPAHIRRNIKQHANLVTANARWIARATLIASDQPGQPARDTEASRARAAKAAAEKRKLKVTTNHNCSLKRGEIVARPSHQGGHILERHGAGWWCTCCRARSIKWEKLAMQMCGGPAEAKWASRASKSSSCRGARRTHKTQKDGDVIWCTRCGAYGTEAPRLLTTACRGKPKGDDRRKGMEWRLRRLEQGLHPKTGAPLVLEKPRAKKQQQQQQQQQQQHGGCS